MQGRIEAHDVEPANGTLHAADTHPPFSDQEKGGQGGDEVGASAAWSADEVGAERPPAATTPLALPPEPPADLGLYAVLGLDPSAPDAEILTTYRRLAARLIANGSASGTAMRQLNTAYEVLSNPLRRREYDRQRLAAMGLPQPPALPLSDSNLPLVAPPRRPRHRPRQSMQPRYPGLGDVFVVAAVVGLSLLAGALLIPHVSFNLSGLSALQFVVPVGLTGPRAATPSSLTPAPNSTAAPTATPSPDLAQRFAGSKVAVSNPTPAPNSFESIVVNLRQDGKPASGVQVWATVQYRTTQERWPASGTVSTDANGAATLSSNIGSATPDYTVQVHVFALVQDETLSWTTSFTPH